MRTAPATSNMVAKMQAWRMVSTLDPTEVPKLLATSFAPTPNAKMNERMNPTITIHSKSGLYGVLPGVAALTTSVTAELTASIMAATVVDIVGVCVCKRQ